MDLPCVQSGTKCGSDFSIERILSQDINNSSKTEEGAPDWLCCTRYQPPRLPRPSSNACRSRRSGRHARVPFTATQAHALEAAYARAPYLAPPALKALAAALQLRDDRIKIWFQNRRARERREKCTKIMPPHGVTLTPTTKAQGMLTNRNIRQTPWNQSFTMPTNQHSMKSDTMSLTPVNIESCLSVSSVNLEGLRRPSPVHIDGEVRDLKLFSAPDFDSSEIKSERCDTPIDIETV